jgi:hypothetical protein
MNDGNVKSVCKIVREMMKVDGRRLIFTNLYSTGTRTVKCYAARAGNKQRDDQLIENIKSVLGKLNVPEFIVRETRGSMWGGPGIIFKFPVQK